jgi:lysophospholipase L1-like esterase
MSIVCIGDSLTFGYGVKETESWVSVLSTKIKEMIINKGIPGNTTTEMKERFIEDVVNYMPSKVLIMGGTNDIFLNSTINDILNNINTVIKMCEINNIVPIILTPLPVKGNVEVKTWFEDMDYKIVNKSLDELRNLLIRYGEEKEIKCIDIGTILLEDRKIIKQFLEDGIHVSAEIHNEIAEIIYNLIF